MGTPRFVLEGASVSKEKKDDKNQNIILFCACKNFLIWRESKRINLKVVWVI